MFNIILYTHNELPDAIRDACFQTLTDAASDACCDGMPQPFRLVVSSIPWPAHFGWQNIIVIGDRGYHDCYVKILAALELCPYTQTFLVEHDVLYPAPYFDWPMPDDARLFWYNRNTWRLNKHGWFPCPGQLTSNCCAHRDLLREQFAARLALVERGHRIVWDEPGRNPGDIAPMADWQCSAPVVDVRWGGNLTGNRDAKLYYPKLPPWGEASEWTRKLEL